MLLFDAIFRFSSTFLPRHVMQNATIDSTDLRYNGAALLSNADRDVMKKRGRKRRRRRASQATARNWIKIVPRKYFALFNLFTALSELTLGRYRYGTECGTESQNIFSDVHSFACIETVQTNGEKRYDQFQRLFLKFVKMTFTRNFL